MPAPCRPTAGSLAVAALRRARVPGRPGARRHLRGGRRRRRRPVPPAGGPVKLAEPPTWYVVSTLFGLWGGFLGAAVLASRLRGTRHLGGRPRAPLPLDRPARDPDRRPAASTSSPSCTCRSSPTSTTSTRGSRRRPSGSPGAPTACGYRDRRRHRGRRAVLRGAVLPRACSCGRWPACSDGGAAGSARPWPSWSPACSSGWPTPSHCSSLGLALFGVVLGGLLPDRAARHEHRGPRCLQPPGPDRRGLSRGARPAGPGLR